MQRFLTGLIIGIAMATAMTVFAYDYHEHTKYEVVNFDREVKKVVEKVMWDHKNWDH